MNLRDEELLLEQEALSAGIRRYNDQLTVRGHEGTRPGQRLMGLTVEPLAKAIRERFEEATGKRQGRRAAIVTKLTAISPETLALIATRVVLQAITERKQQGACARQIGQLVAEHDDWACLTQEAKGLTVTVERQLKKSGSERHRRAVARHVVKRYGETNWTEGEMRAAGAWLLEMLTSNTLLAEVKTVYVRRKRRNMHFVEATQATEELLAKGHAANEGLDPVYMPMVTEPVAWTDMYDGGYYQRDLPLVKLPYAELEKVRDSVCPEVYEAINALQATKYRVNTAVLSVLERGWNEKAMLPDFVPQDPIPLPTAIADVEADPEGFKTWKRMAAQVHTDNAINRGKRLGIMERIKLGNKFAKYDAIYFPHQLDWRGRAYPVPVHLQPQGDDMSKALLCFSEGKPLGAEGVLWFKVHIANLFGVDKVKFGERMQWVDENHEHLLESALDPLGAGDFWTTADKPWQALAACFEYAGYVIEGEDYVSHLPIAMDGSCNGLQHLSAMLRDGAGGKATNLIPSEEPQDIYTTVANRVTELLDTSKKPEAAQWKAVGIPRKLVKRPVMTTPYGVSNFGITGQLDGEVHKLGLIEGEDAHKAVLALSPLVKQAINDTVVGSKLVMDWFQACAKAAAAESNELSWVNPVGLKVVQDYRQMTSKKYTALIGGIRAQYRITTPDTKLNKRKQSAGVSPNIIHSFDGAHMMKTVNACVDAGIHSLAMVHDSYATHACDVGEMSILLREEFVDMYSGNALEELHNQFSEQLPGVEFPEPPQLGTLDIESVRDSFYFFA